MPEISWTDWPSNFCLRKIRHLSSMFDEVAGVHGLGHRAG